MPRTFQLQVPITDPPWAPATRRRAAGLTTVWVLGAAVVATGCSGDDTPGSDGSFDAAIMPDGDLADGALADGAELDGGAVDEDGGPGCAGPEGLYVDGSCETLAAGIEPYAPAFPLWTDGAAKERYVYLPDGMQIDTSDPDAWTFPVGTRLYKTFSRDGKRIETRLLEKTSAGADAGSWAFRVFAWNEEQDFVTEVEDGVENALGTEHDIPAVGLCVRCHAGISQDVPYSFSAIQLNHAGEGVTLEALRTAGRLSDDIDPTDATIPGNAVEQAALGYLHANCGSCHGGPFPVADMNLWVPVGITDPVATPTYMTTIGVASGFQRPDQRFRVVAGDAMASVVHLRMSSRAGGVQMPPIGTEIADPAGIAAVEAWINALPAP